MPTVNRFKEYLLAALPDEYPIASIPLRINMEEAHRKELAFQQAKFLEEAEALITSSPWISFLAAIKHLLLLKFYITDTTTFREISDKEYFDRVQTKAHQILTSTNDLDQETKDYCQRLVAIQLFYNNVHKALDACRTALSLGFNAFEPTVEKPTAPKIKDDSGPGCILALTFIASIYLWALGVYEGNADNTPVEVCFLVSLISFVLLVIWIVSKQSKWKNDKEKKIHYLKSIETYSRFQKLSKEYYSNSHQFAYDLQFDVSQMAKNLKVCEVQLETIINERTLLADQYITPYV